MRLAPLHYGRGAIPELVHPLEQERRRVKVSGGAPLLLDVVVDAAHLFGCHLGLATIEGTMRFQ